MFRQILESKVMYIFVQEIPPWICGNRVSAVMTLALNELSQCGIFGALRFPPWKMAFLDPKQSTFLGQKWDPAAWQWSKMDSHHHDPYGSYGSYGPQNGMSCHWCFKLTALGGPTHFPK